MERWQHFVSLVIFPPNTLRAHDDLSAGYLFTHNLEPIGGQVVGHNHAMSIEDKAAGRRQGLDANAITVGKRRKMLVADDLQYV